MAKMTDFNFDTYLPERKIIVRDTAQLPSRERLEERIRAEIELLEISLKNGGSDSPHNDEELLEVFRLALAAHEQEPVAYILQDAEMRARGYLGILSFGVNTSDEDINEYEISVTPLYTHPAPVPAVPDDWSSSLQELVKAMRDYDMDVDEPAPYKHREMMRRAEALLNGGKS